MIQQGINQIISSIGIMSSISGDKKKQEAIRNRQNEYLRMAQNREERASERHGQEMKLLRSQTRGQNLQNKITKQQAMQNAIEEITNNIEQVADFNEHKNKVGGKANG